MKRKILPACFLLFLWISSFVYLRALDPEKAITQYKLDIWQEERGLTQSSVFVIHQTRDGYTWLGTLNGLVRFDGSRFKVFNKGNTDQLKDNVIGALLEDGQGNLWIGTEAGGLSCLKDGEFKTYSPEEYEDLKKISSIFEDQAGSLWIGTLDNGLIRLKKGEFTTYTTRDGLTSSRIRAFHQDEGGRLWIATSTGLSIRDPSGRFTPFVPESGGFDKYILSMCSTKSGDLWIGCSDGLYCLRNGTFTYYGRTEGLPNPKIRCLYEDSSRNLWAGTGGGGLVRIKKNRIETFSPEDGLASGDVFSIHEDREGNLWIGTLHGGLHRLRDTTFTPYTTREGLSHDIVNCISEDREGSIRFGTEYGVNRLMNGRLTLEWTTKQGLSSNNVTAIIEGSRGDLWIGTWSGLNRYKDGKFKYFKNQNDALYTWIRQVQEDKTGAVRILTFENLSQLYKGEFTVLINKKDVSNRNLICFHRDRHGSFWVGTYGVGLYRLKQGKLTAYTTKEGLVNDEVDCIYEDDQGILYIGTRGGLSLLDNGKFTNYTAKSGLIDRYIYYILEDEAGYLWLTGRTGISRISKKELSDFTVGKIEKINPVLFNQSNGIKSPLSTHGIKTRDGRLWFATDKGAVVVDPSNIKKNTLPPPVVIEEVLVDGEAVSISSLPSGYREETPLVIPPGKKRLEFYYTGLSFVRSRQIKFELKLEGYDSDWVDAGFSRSTTYTSLSPGKYTFRVKACNSDGVWSEKDTSFSFYLKSYFYQTTWFYLSALLFVLLLAFFFHRFRVRQLKTREKELGRLVDLRTSDLKERNLELEKAQQNIQRSKELIEAKNQQLEEQSEKLKEMDEVKTRFFANISHEFRTPLTLIMGPLEQMIAACRENEKEKKRKLSLMLRNAQRLLRLINQLLELSRLDSGKLKLQAVKTNIITFVKGIIDTFQLLAQQKELDLVFHAGQNNEGGAEDIILYIDPRKMEDIMSNLLVNAIKFTPQGGEVKVTLNKNRNNFPEGFVEISVKDTGPGIPHEQLANIFDRFYQADSTYEYHQKGSGIGLALSKELVELHHGTIEPRSREGEGSEFVIRLPLGSAHLAADEIVDIPSSQPPTGDKIPEEEIPGLEMVNEEEEEENEPGPHKTDIILVVEDSADLRDYIREALEPAYTVVGAGDGREGIQKAQEMIPDLIISDIMMPEVNGYELCRELKNHVNTSHIPIILLTAKASEESILEGLETGADDYITKPFNTNILSARIKNLIDLRRQLHLKLDREMTLQPNEMSLSKIDEEFVQELEEVIEKNLSEPEFNVEEMGKKLYMSRATLYRKIYALSGKTPSEFLRSYRLKRAAQLLTSNFGSVTEVAFEVGFSNRNYFTKCFKEQFHQLPSDYKESQ
ncbi:MAG: two-component regulator propeller domain-containing protein [Candidatus Aminicenantes bacterium]|jgi:signal transduction histidine kinase/ligand-binding sensor domain-containing protein/DNA-binding response OmpR family regulator